MPTPVGTTISMPTPEANAVDGDSEEEAEYIGANRAATMFFVNIFAACWFARLCRYVRQTQK